MFLQVDDIRHMTDRDILMLVQRETRGKPERETRHTPNPGSLLSGYVLHLYRRSTHGALAVMTEIRDTHFFYPTCCKTIA